MITAVVPLDRRGRFLGFVMRLCSILLVAWVVIACGCGRNAAPDVMGRVNMPKISLTSTAYGDGQAIPPRITGEGADVSPALSWGAVPDC